VALAVKQAQLLLVVAHEGGALRDSDHGNSEGGRVLVQPLLHIHAVGPRCCPLSAEGAMSSSSQFSDVEHSSRFEHASLDSSTPQ